MNVRALRYRDLGCGVHRGNASFRYRTPKPKPKPRYNVAPSQTAPIVRHYDEALGFHDVKWHLYESWWRNIDRGPQINARADKVLKNAMYKHSFTKRRCLVLATGWYEWNKKRKSEPPRFIRMKDQRPVMFAGIWTTYHSDEKKIHADNFAIITTEAHDKIAGFHDRMPVLIKPKDYEKWLDPKTSPIWLEKQLLPYKGCDIEVVQVSDHVNSYENQGKDCIEPLEVA